jgi:hypothetical protein
MVSFVVVVSDVFGKNVLQRALAKQVLTVVGEARRDLRFF